MGFIRQIKQRGKIYYAEVENQWINGKCVQKHIRSLGTDPKNPTTIPIEPAHFSYLALRLMQDALMISLIGILRCGLKILRQKTF
jgi:hypothetical protein